jgi:hypothetical protein
MLTAQKWVVCEHSGRWTAALRTAFARLPNARRVPRLYEVRTLGELSICLDERPHDLTLIEVAPQSRIEIIAFLTRRGPLLGPFVALLGSVAERPDPIIEKSGEAAADLLWEMGAAEVVESPRQLRGLVALHDRLLTARGPDSPGLGNRHSFAEWAWSTLPWQDQ